MDELEEQTKKWEAYFSGKKYSPVKVSRKAKKVLNNSRVKYTMSRGDTYLRVSQPSAFAHLSAPFFIRIGTEHLEVRSISNTSRTEAYMQVIRGVLFTSPGNHNRGTRVRIIDSSGWEI